MQIIHRKGGTLSTPYGGVLITKKQLLHLKESGMFPTAS